MANKLYEETAIQDIAEAIRETNGSTDTYTVAQMGDAVREQNRLVFKGEITETILGLGKYAVLAKSDKLKEIRNETNLLVRVEFDNEPAAYTIRKAWGVVSVEKMPAYLDYWQINQRYDANSQVDINRVIYAINDGTSITTSVARIFISEDGELRIYSNSNSNYAIRPSKYTAIVEW